MTTRIGVPPLFVQGICVSADSKNPNLALAFAQYVTNNANQVDFVKLAQASCRELRKPTRTQTPLPPSSPIRR